MQSLLVLVGSSSKTFRGLFRNIQNSKTPNRKHFQQVKKLQLRFFPGEQRELVILTWVTQGKLCIAYPSCRWDYYSQLAQGTGVLSCAVIILIWNVSVMLQKTLEVTQLEKQHRNETCFSTSSLSAKISIFSLKIHQKKEGYRSYTLSQENYTVFFSKGQTKSSSLS